LYVGAQISENVPFTYLLKNNNKELGKIYEFVLYKRFHGTCDKPFLVLKECTGIPD
jgi:hypothetical protein